MFGIGIMHTSNITLSPGVLPRGGSRDSTTQGSSPQYRESYLYAKAMHNIKLHTYDEFMIRAKSGFSILFSYIYKVLILYYQLFKYQIKIFLPATIL